MYMFKKVLYCVCFIIALSFSSFKAIAWEETDLPVFAMRLGLEIGGNFQDGRFNYPAEVAVDTDGKVYVQDIENNRIQIFSSSGQFLSKINTFGDKEWQFAGLGDIALDSQNNLYAIDVQGENVVKFNSSGEYVSRFSMRRPGDTSYYTPCRLAVDSSGNVYVSDGENRNVKKFDSSGEYVTAYQFPGGQYYPSSIAVGPNGHIYVVVQVRGEVQEYGIDMQDEVVEFNSDMTLVGTIYTYEHISTTSIYDIELDSLGNILLADGANGNSVILKLNSSGEYLSQFGGKGVGHGLLLDPIAIGVDNRNNDIYVIDFPTQSLQKFDSAGEYILTVGLDLTVNGFFNNPSDVAVGPDGAIYVADSSNYRVQKFNSLGVYQSKFGHYRVNALEEDGFMELKSIEVDDDGNIYVSDSDGYAEVNFVKKFDPDFNLIFEIETRYPRGISVDSSGSIYFVDSSDIVIKKYSSDGEFIANFGDGIMGMPYGVSLDSSGNMYLYGYRPGEGAKVVKMNAEGVVVHSLLVGPVVYSGGTDVSDVAVEKNGNIYISTITEDGETGIKTSSILKYDSAWNLLFTLTGEQGGFDTISGLEIDDNGNLFVVEGENGRVLKFMPDKLPPSVEVDTVDDSGSNAKISVQGEAVDALTSITSVQYQVDSQLLGGWKNCTPADGSWDSKTEDFSFNLSSKSLDSGSHVVYIKAVDSKNNEGVKGVSIEIPSAEKENSVTTSNEKETVYSSLFIKDKDGNPLLGALVEILGETYTTDENGEVRIPDLEAGSYSIKITYNGTESEQVLVVTEAGSDLEIVFGVDTTQSPTIPKEINDQEVEEPIAKTNYYLWGGIILIVFVIAILVVRKMLKK